MERLLIGPVFASCEETEEHLSDNLEGELGPLRRWRVARHLDHCIRCSAILRSLKRTIVELRVLGRSDMAPAGSPTVVDDVVERIRRDER